MKELEAKFAEADKPDFDALLEIEKTIESKIDRLGASARQQQQLLRFGKKVLFMSR